MTPMGIHIDCNNIIKQCGVPLSFNTVLFNLEDEHKQHPELYLDFNIFGYWQSNDLLDPSKVPLMAATLA